MSEPVHRLLPAALGRVLSMLSVDVVSGLCTCGWTEMQGSGVQSCLFVRREASNRRSLRMHLGVNVYMHASGHVPAFLLSGADMRCPLAA